MKKSPEEIRILELEMAEAARTPAEGRIRFVRDAEMQWDWDSSNPLFNSRTPKAGWGNTRKFDPFPCYAHDVKMVTEYVRKVEKLFPVGLPTYYFIYEMEPLDRINGEASYNTIEYTEDRSQNIVENVIKLYGKRIPIMPAMTRYLVAHEYGHIVDNWINRCIHVEYNGLDEEYTKLRGLPNVGKEGGRNWHANVGEVIANDFRIVVCGVEPEFWPHPCPHPNEDVKVRDWWYEAMLKYSV